MGVECEVGRKYKTFWNLKVANHAIQRYLSVLWYITSKMPHVYGILIYFLVKTYTGSEYLKRFLRFQLIKKKCTPSSSSKLTKVYHYFNTNFPNVLLSTSLTHVIQLFGNYLYNLLGFQSKFSQVFQVQLETDYTNDSQQKIT